MKKILLLLYTIIMILVFFSACGYDGGTKSNSDISSLTQNSSTLSSDIYQEPMDANEILGSTAAIYQIDKAYINEINQNLHVSNAEKGNITFKYIEQWKEKMEYYYNILYDLLNEEGKKILKNSQDNWQKALDSDLSLNEAIQVQNNIIYDVFDNPKYTAYRTRAIALFIKCSSMNNLDDSSYVALE